MRVAAARRASRRDADRAPCRRSAIRSAASASARCSSQVSGASTSALAISFRSPSVSRKRFDSRSTSAGDGSSATKWRASLSATCAAVAGWRARSASTARPCSTPPVRIALAEDRLRPGLVQARIEHELAAVLRIGRHRPQGPAGDHLGEAIDIVLRVDGAHAERMQLENLAREVLVQPASC